jgi:hypothetical protein
MGEVGCRSRSVSPALRLLLLRLGLDRIDGVRHNLCRMPHDPIQAANALARLQVAEAKFVEASEERRIAILEAVRADNPLREVGDIAHCSRETIRRIVAAGGEATINLDDCDYLLPGQSVDFVLFRLKGFGQGAFRPNPAVHGTDDAWLGAADHLAGQIEAALSDETGEMVRLTNETAFALHQSLLQSQKTNPSVLVDLTEALGSKYRLR